MATKKAVVKKSNEPFIMTIEELVALRKARGENQGAFWNRVQITQSGASRYEAGRDVNKHALIVATLTYGPADNAHALLESMRNVE